MSAMLAIDPPGLFIPSLGDAPLGWSIALIVLLGPILFSLFSWQRRRGRWSYFFTQWRSSGFWLLWCGTLVAAGGIFGLVGMAPTWQDRWTDWYITATTAANPDRLGLGWLRHLEREYALILQAATAGIFLFGAAAVLLGLTGLARRMAAFRSDPDAWLVTSPESQKVPAVQRGRWGRRFERTSR